MSIPKIDSQQQSCKNCGVRDGLNFNVSDSIWEKVVPKRLVNKVVCLACFDRFAARRGIDYRRNIRILYFAGRQACFRFRVISSSRGYDF
jgi:hypothetical protein